MPVRRPPLDNYGTAFENMNDRIRRLEDTSARRVLPPGYEFEIAAGNLVITRISDGATATLVFT